LEELLRAYSAVTTFRTCIKPVQIAGVQIMPGDKVAMATTLANRDPAYDGIFYVAVKTTRISLFRALRIASRYARTLLVVGLVFTAMAAIARGAAGRGCLRAWRSRPDQGVSLSRLGGAVAVADAG